MVVIQQGQIWWGEQTDEKPRPFLILTRQSAIENLESVSVAAITSRVRGLASEMHLGRADGVPRDCVANFDNVRSIRKSMLTRPIGALAPGRWHEVCEAIRAAIDC